MSSAEQNDNSYQFVLASACLLLILSFGYRAGFGLFMVPMSEAREWGRDVLALALAIQNLSWGVCAILAGALADKYGNLRVLLSGVVLYAIGMMSMSISTHAPASCRGVACTSNDRITRHLSHPDAPTMLRFPLTLAWMELFQGVSQKSQRSHSQTQQHPRAKNLAPRKRQIRR